MGGQAAEQIIAGVVLSERLAVTMYGAIHRAQFGGQRNLRGLVVDPKMLEEDAFRIALTDAKNDRDASTELEHPNIVPTIAVEAGGPDVVDRHARRRPLRHGAGPDRVGEGAVASRAASCRRRSPALIGKIGDRGARGRAQGRRRSTARSIRAAC